VQKQQHTRVSERESERVRKKKKGRGAESIYGRRSQYMSAATWQEILHAKGTLYSLYSARSLAKPCTTYPFPNPSGASSNARAQGSGIKISGLTQGSRTLTPGQRRQSQGINCRVAQTLQRPEKETAIHTDPIASDHGRGASMSRTLLCNSESRSRECPCGSCE
jgi:hypothetical protein